MTFEKYVKKNYGCEPHELNMLFGIDLEKTWNASAAAHKPRWIPVSERFPDKHGFYPALRQNIPFRKEEYFNGDEFIKDSVTHWLELPELPDDE